MNINSTEKITINVNTADLGKIDLLIHEGYYSNRTDFIKSAIKRQIDKHGDEINIILSAENRKDWFIGVYVLTVDELKAMKQRGCVKTIRGMGLLIVEKNVSLELMKTLISTIEIYGVCRCNNELKQYYGI